MAMTPEEKRLYIGLAIFGTLAGGGVYVIVEHAIWGAILIIGGLLGLAYGLWEGRAMASRNWLWLLALLLTWAGIGYDIYDRHRFETGPLDNTATQASLNDQQTKILNHLKRMGASWGNYNYQNVSNRTFDHETVLLDGKRFVNCQFRDVTLVYEGTAPFEMSAIPVVRWSFSTDLPQLAPILRLFSAAGLIPPSRSIPPVSAH